MRNKQLAMIRTEKSKGWVNVILNEVKNLFLATVSDGREQLSASNKPFKFLKGLLTAICTLIVLTASAQIYPVQVTPQLVPPYSFRLSDYGTTTSERLFVNLLLTDAQESGRRVRLKMYLEGQGLNVRTVDPVSGATPIFLDGGANLRLTNLDLQPYFSLNNLLGITPQQYGAPLPEGRFDLCFEVFDYFSGRPISRKSCTSAFLRLNEPPLLNLPGRGDLVTARTPPNILFNWTPRHMFAPVVQYEFTLKELWDTGMDPQAAFLASPVLHRTTTFATTLLYGPAETPLLEGRTYGWQVRAFSSDGINEPLLFRNNGRSEIYHFTHRADCNPPRFALSKARNARNVEVTWQSSTHLRYRVEYRKKGYGDDDWFGQWTRDNSAFLRNLEPGTIYDFRVGGECTPNGGLAFTAVHEFTTPTEEELAYYNCGIPPEVEISNQWPLQNLGVNEVFTAGDFPVVVREVSGSNGDFTGWGYITLPFLEGIREAVDVANVVSEGEVNLGKFTRIRVEFNHIKVNTDYQLVDGLVITSYDPNWSGIADVDQAIAEIIQLWDELFGQKEELLDQLGQAETLEQQQGIISQINMVEVTIAQEIDAIPGKENLPKELQEELEGLKQESGIVATEMLSQEQIDNIKTGDARRRERVKEIVAMAEEMSIFGDDLLHHVMAVVNGYWCANNNGEQQFEYFYGRGTSFFDFQGELDELGIGDIHIEFKNKGENHGKKEFSTQYRSESGKVLESIAEASYDGHYLAYDTSDVLTNNSNEFRICFRTEEDLEKFETHFLVSAPTTTEFYYTKLEQKINRDIASDNFDNAHLSLTMLPKCGFENFSVAHRIALINSMLDDRTGTDGLQEQLIIRLLSEYGDGQTSSMAEVYRSIDLEKLFNRVDDEESDLLTYVISDYVGKYHSLNEKKYGGTASLVELTAWDLGSRYVILNKGGGKYSLQLRSSYGGGQGAGFTTSESIFTDTDIFSTFTIAGEDSEIPYILLLKGVLTQEDERSLKQMSVALDLASMVFGVGELKLAFSASTKLARAFRLTLASADLSATAANVVCEGPGMDSALCEDWKKVGTWVQLGVVSASGADLLYQTLKKSPALQDEVLRLGGTAIVKEHFVEGLVNGIRRYDISSELANGATITRKINTNGRTVTLKWIIDNNGIIGFGNRSDLAKALGTLEEEAHHILTWTKSGNHSVVQIAAKDGFHLNIFENGIGLSKYRKSLGEGMHGNHPAYDNYVVHRLTQYKRLNSKFTSKEANEFIQTTLIPEMRQLIEQANESIYNLNDYFKQVINPSVGTLLKE